MTHPHTFATWALHKQEPCPWDGNPPAPPRYFFPPLGQKTGTGEPHPSALGYSTQRNNTGFMPASLMNMPQNSAKAIEPVMYNPLLSTINMHALFFSHRLPTMTDSAPSHEKTASTAMIRCAAWTPSKLGRPGFASMQRWVSHQGR